MAFFTEQRPQGRKKRNAMFQSGQLKQPLHWTNPLDKFSKRSRCAICQCTFNWAKDCPHKKTEQVRITEDANVEECNIALLTKASMSDTEIYMTESLRSAIIDAACTHTVCGEKWLESYIDDLTQDQTPSCRPFRFGDGNLVYSTRNMKLPVKIGLTKCKIESEVVKADIPLQLSKTSLKKEGTILDMEKDSAVMFKQSIPLEFTSSGHYCVDIKHKETKTGQTEE